MADVAKKYATNGAFFNFIFGNRHSIDPKRKEEKCHLMGSNFKGLDRHAYSKLVCRDVALCVNEAKGTKFYSIVGGEDPEILQLLACCPHC